MQTRVIVKGYTVLLQLHFSSDVVGLSEMIHRSDCASKFMGAEWEFCSVILVMLTVLSATADTEL